MKYKAVNTKTKTELHIVFEDNDILVFKDFVSRVKRDCDRAGYKKPFTFEQIDMINGWYTNFNNDPPPQTIVSGGGNLTPIYE